MLEMRHLICLAAAWAWCSPAAAQSPPLYSFSEEAEHDGKLEVAECKETERQPHSSVIVYRIKGLGSVGSSLFHVYCICQVGKLRGMRYALTLSEAERADGKWEQVIGLTNSPTDLPALFGRPATDSNLMDSQKFCPTSELSITPPAPKSPR